MKGKHLTDALVGGACFLALIVVAWKLLSPLWFVVALIATLYEAYCIANNQPEDTISETIWRFSDTYSLLPMAGGSLLTYGIAIGYISNPWVIAILCVLAGHFWFPRYNKRLMDD